MCNLGILYLEGTIIPSNIEKGKELLQKAIDMGNAEAMYHMGALMLKNIGFTNRQEEGKSLLNTAYNRGIIKATEFFANGYADGTNGLRKDLSLSRQWHKRAAEQGSVNSMLELGHLYRKGIGVESNLKEALKWYTEAKKNDSKIAWLFMGATYEEMQDFQAAISCYKESYRIGIVIPQATSALGRIYYYHLKNYNEAAHWYQKSAALEDAHAQMTLGMMYGRGHGVSNDYNECAKYLMLARDNPEASPYVKKCSAEKLSLLSYNGARWTKKLFAII